MFEKLWGLVTDPRNLRIAFGRVSRNRGRRTGGIDRVTVHHVLHSGVDAFLQQIREELRAGTFRPSPVRRVLIPKAGKPGKFRPLGIPTVKDRVLSATQQRPLDTADIQQLLAFNPEADLAVVRSNLALIEQRGYHRDQDLGAKLDAILAVLAPV